MKVVDQQKQKTYYESQTEKARKDMINAIKDRDKVLNDIESQRDGVRIVSRDLYLKESKKIDTILLLKALQKNLKQNRNFYAKLNNRQNIYLRDIESKIEKMKLGTVEVEEKYEKELLKLKDTKKVSEELQNKKEEIKKLEHKKSKLEEENKLEEEKISKERKKLIGEKKEWDSYIKQIKTKEKKLNRKEVRLNNFYLELKEKKYGKNTKTINS